MDYQDKQEIAEGVMEALYNHWSSGGRNQSLEALREKHRWESNVFDTVLDYLENYRGFIDASGAGSAFNLTTSGILYAEEIGIGDRESGFIHQRTREEILAVLAESYDEMGIEGFSSYDEILAASSYDDTKVRLGIAMLKDIGWIEDSSSSSFRITYQGLANFEDGEFLPRLI